MERMLILGAFNIEYIHNNSREPFKEVLGSRCISLNVLPLLFYIGATDLEKSIISLVKEQNIRQLHVYHDWIKGAFSDSFWSELTSYCQNISAFYPDDEPGIWMDNNAEHYDAHYKTILTHSLSAQFLRRQKGHENVYHLPWGFNKHIFYPITIAPDADIVFIGKNKISDSSATGVEDGERRDKLLYACAKFAEQHRLQFAIYGYGWDSHPELAQFWRGVLPIEEFAGVYGAAQVVINPAWAPGSDAPQVKLRHFEVYGSGARQLTNQNPELVATIGKTDAIVYFTDVADAVTKLAGIFDEHAMAFIPNTADLEKHSIQSRIVDIVDIVGFGADYQQSCVVHINPPSRLDIRTLFELLREQFLAHPEAEFIHINTLDGLAKSSCDDSWLELYADKENISLFGMLFDFSHFQSNHLHFSDMNGDLSCIFIEDEKSLSRVEQLFLHSPFSRDGCLVKIGNKKYPLTALVFPRSIIEAGENKFLSRLPTVCTDYYPFEFKFVKDKVALAKPARVRRKMLGELDVLNDIFKNMPANVCVYGAGGSLGYSILQYLLENYPEFNLFVVDNRNAGSFLLGQRVYDKTICDKTEMDIVLIVAELSGPAIYAAMLSTGVKSLVRCYDCEKMVKDLDALRSEKSLWI